MNRQLYRLLTVLLTALLMLAGCGSSDTGTAVSSAKEEHGLPGRYKMTELYDEKGTSLTEQLTELSGQDQYIILTLLEDGTGTYLMFEDEQTITWTEHSITLNDETLTMNCENDTLTVSSGEETKGKMVFVRLPDEPQDSGAAPSAPASQS